MKDVTKFNRGVPDVNVLYDILVAKGTFTDSEQHAIEQTNTSYVANQTAHLWSKKAAEPTPVAVPPAAAAEHRKAPPDATPAAK